MPKKGNNFWIWILSNLEGLKLSRMIGNIGQDKDSETVAFCQYAQGLVKAIHNKDIKPESFGLDVYVSVLLALFKVQVRWRWHLFRIKFQGTNEDIKGPQEW